ncbi:MAG: response regulator [Candidatus Eisenbacteria bacterium]|nr:response regulator [Candidatus Eisenbacteria bacterium]
MRILWADDEVDLLKPHVIFLRERGYEVVTVTSGDEAIRRVREERFDAVLLDEMMPGRDGLSTLEGIKELHEDLPVIMITKSEEEDLVETAIRKRINDYLLKPVNPVQILSALRRVLEKERIESTGIARDYLGEFNRIRALAQTANADDWIDIHRRLSRWDLELERFREVGLKQTQEDVRREMNAEFARFVEKHYAGWVGGEKSPPLSTDLVDRWVLPLLEEGKRVYLVIIDCMRLDQWMEMERLLDPYFQIRNDHYYSILPSATPYARNGIFSGLLPMDLARIHPKYWQEQSEEEGSKNRHEKQLLEAQLERRKVRLRRNLKYVKIYNPDEGNQLKRQVSSLFSVPFVALVINFVDIFTHGRSESDILRELAPDEAAFRSVMTSWFRHSSLFEILRAISSQDATVVLTSDHGAILGRKATMVHANRETSTNLRYKHGSNLGCDERHAVKVKNPEDYKLPRDSLNKNYIFARENYYFVYPTRYHEYERQYRNTFQHGGISLEEMILPCAVLTPKR